MKNEFLELQHVNLSDSGTYSVEVFDVNGKRIKSYSEIVCVYAKVPKPRVNITCQDEKVDFRCDVEGFKPATLSGFDFWLMLGLLAGGGGLVLLLIIVLVTVACRACKRREKQQQVVFHLSNLHTAPPPGYQKSKHSTRGDFHHQPDPRKMAQIKKHEGPL
ncbi:hypothetical protein PDJAM_G00039770 [Pangasius djambal]|uniref:Uncharacterized protein n=1 Tax=Pangasius djambal TaxID=1691987 RepID=A0ACC5YTW7_9TELE|nr:hypothetical protein [Pangasius djambal]